MKPRPARKPTPQVRCAIYTRKSTEEGLEQEFNSLDAQRRSAEAFIHSQAAECWLCLPQRYDDGGFTGSNTERPALQRLLADIAAGQLDAVLVYQVDRLSRSLLDFARPMEVFEQHGVSFVSVTQQFNSRQSMGRLTLNLLLTFAQFERELIAERTRDKLAATCRQGKWAGGSPVLGYDLAPRGKRLVVNQAEAERVRAIFALYLAEGALAPVVAELDRRGWVNKRRSGPKGRSRGGQPFTPRSLRRLLTNVLYRGQVRYRNEVYPGEQPALVDETTWQKVQALLQDPEPSRRSKVGLGGGALLVGLLRCGPCGAAMTPAQASKKGRRRYRYYVCTRAQRRGWKHCPCPSLPAEAVERFVWEQVRDFMQARGFGARIEEEYSTTDHVRLVEALVQSVAYDGSKVAITFHADGLRRLSAPNSKPTGESVP